MKMYSALLCSVLLSACAANPPGPSDEQDAGAKDAGVKDAGAVMGEEDAGMEAMLDGGSDAGIPGDVRAWYSFDAPFDGGLAVPDETGTYGATQFGMSVIAGKVGQALAWDADGQALRIPEASLDDLAEGTMAMWVRRDASGLLRLFAKVNPGVSAEMGVELTADDFVSFFLDGQLKVPFTFGVDTFHHLALTWGATGKRIYVDGQLIGSDMTPATLGSSATLSEFGRDPNQPATTGSRGALDEVRIYARELAQHEIQALASQ